MTTQSASRETKRAKKFVCDHPGCNKSFTRSDHLRRHALNHEVGDSTCPRCSVHFKRSDLLERHLARHRQKDIEAGGEGLGVIETRKKLWKDADGKIVSRRPSSNPQPPASAQASTTNQPELEDGDATEWFHENQTTNDNLLPNEEFAMLQDQLQPTDLSYQQPLGEMYTEIDAMNSLAVPDVNDFLANSSWGSESSRPVMAPHLDMLFDDYFPVDAGNSFGMPFATKKNYNWLFNIQHENEGEPISSEQGTNISIHQLPSQESVHQSGSSILVSSAGAHSYEEIQAPASYHHSSSDSDVMNLDGNLPDSSAQHDSPYDEHGDITRSNGQDSLPRSSSTSSSAHSPFSSYQPATYCATTTTHTALIEKELVDEARQHGNSSSEYSFGSSVQAEHLSAYPHLNMPVLQEEAWKKVLGIINQAKPRTPEGVEISNDHPLLSLPAMQRYSDQFFAQFNFYYPLIHQATFRPSEADSLLLLSMLMIGATYGEKAEHLLAVCIHDVMRTQIFQYPGFTGQPDLWTLQTVLLVECFGKFRAGQRQHDLANLFRGLLVSLIRKSDCQTVREPRIPRRPADVESEWRNAMNVEQRKRVAYLCFIWDTQHAVLFSQTLSLSAFELRTMLPCSSEAWEAGTAKEWFRVVRKDTTIPFLTVLKAYTNPGSNRFPLRLNLLSRTLVLHGLMSIQWDMKRRDQTSLGYCTFFANERETWQGCLANSFDVWKADFDGYCMDVMLSLSDRSYLRSEFVRLRTATTALYHAAHITLNVEILDLQIHAGAKHIIGRPVHQIDYERSLRSLKDWAKPNGLSAARAAWHAAHLLRDGILTLGDWSINTAFHYSWCLYLAVITLRAFYSAGTGDIRQDLSMEISSGHSSSSSEREEFWDAKSEMNQLVSSMTSGMPENLWRLQKIGNVSTTGLTVVMAKHLGNIRWAVVHEAMKVLRGCAGESSWKAYERFLQRERNIAGAS